MTKDRRPHIGIYGRRNNGKSTFINRITNQDIAIVSEVAGTTTDPVKKAYEITGFGAVTLIDTAGIDDVGVLGAKRIEKTVATIKQTDLAVLLVANNQCDEFELNLISQFKSLDTPFLVIHSKSDVTPMSSALIDVYKKLGVVDILEYSQNDSQVESLIGAIKHAIPELSYQMPSLVGGLIKQGDIVLLITPIDIEAPEGRLILPQVQAIRDILDNDAVCIVLKEREVDAFLKRTAIIPALVITDSQVFPKADASIPKEIPLTSFSIILAHQKGDFANYLKGTPTISELKDGDRVLMLESCSHHTSCDDIGRVKIPRWLANFTGKQLEADVVAGLGEIKRPITDYALVIQCGGCMITRKQLINRLKPAIDAGVPVTNYGMAIAYVHGIFNRATEPFTKGVKPRIDYI